MEDHIQIKTHEDNNVHFYRNNSYTLCGTETDGDETLGIEIGKMVDKKVNCPDCIEIINFCEDIKNSEFINPTNTKPE